MQKCIPLEFGLNPGQGGHFFKKMLHHKPFLCCKKHLWKLTQEVKAQTHSARDVTKNSKSSDNLHSIDHQIFVSSRAHWLKLRSDNKIQKYYLLYAKF